MTRSHTALTAVALAAALLTPWSTASGQRTAPVRFGGTAGLDVPLSDLSRQTQTGLLVDAFLTGAPEGWPAALRGELSYSSFPGALDRPSQHVAGFTLNAILPASSAGSAPYVLGGVGLYDMGSYAGRPSENDAGVDLGVGYRWQRPGVSYFAEARITDVAHTGVSRQMLPIVFGVIF
ncbi:MAG: hypothetical protein KGJ70_03745 [Gemmatimonadota bacterium]|nr:hypothetical protein [Gemmatimonadota bacterium]